MSAVVSAIKKVATGPHLSKNLSIDEAREAMLEILAGKVDPVQTAVFFIGLRMKIETNDENLGILLALQEYTQQHRAEVSNLLTFSDPFNGYNRHCPVLAFLPAVLAASGLPCISQGVKEMGPKFGVTHSQVLALAGKNTYQPVDETVKQLNSPDIAWGYVDQSIATPNLFALEDLRNKIIKRPSLATLEKLVMPIKAKRNHLAVGFVHKAYPKVLTWLSHQAGFDTALVVRGIEGGILPTLRKESNNYSVREGQTNELALCPKTFGIKQNTRGALPKQFETVTAEETLDIGLQALSGQEGVAFDSLVLAAAMNLCNVGLQSSPQDAAKHVRQVIQSGQAKDFFMAGLK